MAGIVAVWVVWVSRMPGPGGLPATSVAPPAAPDLKLTSKAAVLMDAASGQVLYELHPDEALPPASVTKIMTLMLALEAVQDGRVRMTDEVVASDHAASMGGSQIWLEPGERMSLRDLLYAIGVGSANDAAVAVAEHLAGSEPAFVEMMNQRARQLGMKHTHFANSTGLPPQETGDPGPHVASARDLAILSRQAIQTPGLLDFVSTWEYTMRHNSIKKPVLYNFNRLLKRYPGVDGLKTGMTSEAGYCVAATSVRDHLRLIAVTMGAPTAKDRDADVRALFDWGFRRYEARRLASKGDVVGQAEVVRGDPMWVPLVLAQDAFMTVERGSRLTVRQEAELPGILVAPLAADARVGTVRILDQTTGSVLAEVPVQVTQTVGIASWSDLVGRQVRSFVQAWIPVERKPAPREPK
ncbi:D-alanyl-D-alanine carboxypeptidase family protein [Carboxydochorda subterranea]|uniref:serine-type D-Ala-D-Ala carboxypeptidase n=1 Tax=Carboxydichorda subterranea TaxID=3109565 RepID=A0ABZ1C1P0_9FIRM|nr:D-alanyl-D-alanine carboxypeptidase family protein [Limnochorda sp. L945t]WRP18923.1 D-alanyl-D-alanine carboxypeptidase family protein [Limnochorda sp. L945t]